MEIQRSLFDSLPESVGNIPLRKKIGPSPMGKNSMVILTEKHPEIQHKEEVDLLMKETVNRMYIKESEYKERIEISKLLIGASEKFRMTISDVVREAMKLLKNMPNLYINQAIYMATEEPIYGFATKKSIANNALRRPICKKS